VSAYTRLVCFSRSVVVPQCGIALLANLYGLSFFRERGNGGKRPDRTPAETAGCDRRVCTRPQFQGGGICGVGTMVAWLLRREAQADVVRGKMFSGHFQPHKHGTFGSAGNSLCATFSTGRPSWQAAYVNRVQTHVAERLPKEFRQASRSRSSR
jgi:hypothetical protein